jgi:hypothetical protein
VDPAAAYAEDTGRCSAPAKGRSHGRAARLVVGGGWRATSCCSFIRWRSRPHFAAGPGALRAACSRGSLCRRSPSGRAAFGVPREVPRRAPSPPRLAACSRRRPARAPAQITGARGRRASQAAAGPPVAAWEGGLVAGSELVAASRKLTSASRFRATRRLPPYEGGISISGASSRPSTSPRGGAFRIQRPTGAAARGGAGAAMGGSFGGGGATT